MRAAEGALRRRLPFRTVNCRGEAGFQPGMQRHHLLPRELLSARWFGALFERVGRERLGFDDFRRNGLLLPCEERMAVRVGLPMHRGPHRDYNAMVCERVGQIEGTWAERRSRRPGDALDEAYMRLTLLQGALRRRLLADRRRLRLNRSDPLGTGRDFAELDAMAEWLWRETAGTDPLLSPSAVDPYFVVGGIVTHPEAECAQLIEADIGVGRGGAAQASEFGAVVMPGEEIEQAR